MLGLYLNASVVEVVTKIGVVNRVVSITMLGLVSGKIAKTNVVEKYVFMVKYNIYLI